MAAVKEKIVTLVDFPWNFFLANLARSIIAFPLDRQRIATAANAQGSYVVKLNLMAFDRKVCWQCSSRSRFIQFH